MIMSILSTVLNLSGTTITLRDTVEPGAIAEVYMDNRSVNSPADEKTTTLTLNGLDVVVSFFWNVEGDADQVTVVPPDGYACKPTTCEMTIPEDETGKVLIIEYVGF